MAEAGPKPPSNPECSLPERIRVATDAVAMAVIGYDPMADRGTPPFATADNTLHLAEDLGVGVRDLSRNEIVGTPIKDVVFSYAAVRDKILAAQKKA